MTKRLIIIIVGVAVVCGLIFLLSPKIFIKQPDQDSPVSNINVRNIECERSGDCLIGGCSNTLCLPRDRAAQTYSTCEWQPEYACYNEDSCLCNQGRCEWSGSEAFTACISQLK